MKTLHWILLTICILVSNGCNPQRNKGDLIVASGGSGPISNTKGLGATIRLYGIEREEPRVSYNRKRFRFITLFVITPEGETWKYSGGGSAGRPFLLRLFYSARWIDYPIVHFAKPEANGDIKEKSERRDFKFEFNGRNRTIEIAGKVYPITVGDFVFVKLNSKWEPQVWIGAESLNSIPISVVTRKIIMKHINKTNMISTKVLVDKET